MKIVDVSYCVFSRLINIVQMYLKFIIKKIYEKYFLLTSKLCL
jgi:hypothetical protein